MTARPRVLVVQHEDDCPVGFVAPWLQEAGLDCELLAAHRGHRLPVELVDHVALVVLGGQMGAEDDADHAWLSATKRLVAATVASGLPFLGVCLGHQLAASALGGTVTPNPYGPTRSLLPFTPTVAARSDPLTSALAAGAPVLHWNNDVAAELPATAVPLASAPDGTVQAARFGRRAWGVQFHPEVTAAIVRRWAHGDDPVTEGRTLAELGTRQAELHRTWAPLVRRFGELALSRPAAVA